MPTDRPARARRLAEVLRLAALLAAGAAAAATAAVAQPPAPPSAAPRPARPARHRPADAAFMRGMIGHHAQALAMTALVPARARRPEVRLIAERIEVSQHDEIALMRRWLADRGEPAPDSAGAPGGHGAHDAHDAHGTHAGAHAGHGAAPAMPGMLTADELARLAAARGDAFDRLFLTYMIRHHEGALTMVARLLATPGAAQESETFGFASDVDADQRAEIARMRALLGAPTPTSRQPR